jgi:branched-chain amino acid aminotransferase
VKNLDWKNLPFCYLKTDYNVRCYTKNGSWGELEVSDTDQMTISIGATCLHYGQECFEGLKAFKGKDNKIRLFRYEENIKRMNRSAVGLLMPEFPRDKFKEALITIIQKNIEYMPPYGSGATFYLRPLLIGLGPILGVRPAKEFMFLVFGNPVGPYFKQGFKPSEYMICRDFDRAAPLGTGHMKVGGNYAASLRSVEIGKQKGFTSIIYLDAKEKKYIDECGHTNFFAIKGNTYITPDSRSVLPSITNMSLMELAKDMGMKVEKRPVPVDELATFDEVGGCGTAAIISPINKIVDEQTGTVYTYCKDGKPGPVSEKLYNRLTAIQFGETEDTFGWTTIIE